MTNSLKICALIPTFNNAGTIIDVVKRTHNQLNDIIVVVDGSTDNTLNSLETLDFSVNIISYPKNHGKGYALKQGFNYAKEHGYDYVLTLDADGQHFPEDIPVLVNQEITTPNTLIIGSRGLQHDNMPRKNTFANKFSNFWFTLQTGVRLPDTQSGMRIYPLKDVHFPNLLTNKYESELELLVFLSWAGVRIVDVPIRVYYPPAEERVSHFRPFWDFFRISILNTILCCLAIVYGLPRKYIFRL